MTFFTGSTEESEGDEVIALKDGMRLAFFSKSGNHALVTVMAGDGGQAALMVAWACYPASKEDMAALENVLSEKTGLPVEFHGEFEGRKEAGIAAGVYLKGGSVN